MSEKTLNRIKTIGEIRDVLKKYGVCDDRFVAFMGEATPKFIKLYTGSEEDFAWSLPHNQPD
jgi:hypothetical protein